MHTVIWSLLLVGFSIVPSDARAEGGGTIREPKCTKKVQPAFPERAQRAGLNGIVILETTVAPDGHVREAKILRGYRMLGEAAASAVRQWKYTPTLLDGKPTQVTMTITVNFQLERRPSRNDLLQSLRDEDPDVRWSAATWLALYRPATPDQRAALEAAVNDSDAGVAKAASESLAKLAK